MQLVRTIKIDFLIVDTIMMVLCRMLVGVPARGTKASSHVSLVYRKASFLDEVVLMQESSLCRAARIDLHTINCRNAITGSDDIEHVREGL